jgi:hypothetical protein
VAAIAGQRRCHGHKHEAPAAASKLSPGLFIWPLPLPLIGLSCGNLDVGGIIDAGEVHYENLLVDRFGAGIAGSATPREATPASGSGFWNALPMEICGSEQFSYRSDALAVDDDAEASTAGRICLCRNRVGFCVLRVRSGLDTD